MSRDGMLPRIFSRVNPHTLTPTANTIIVGCVGGHRGLSALGGAVGFDQHGDAGRVHGGFGGGDHPALSPPGRAAGHQGAVLSGAADSQHHLVPLPDLKPVADRLQADGDLGDLAGIMYIFYSSRNSILEPGSAANPGYRRMKRFLVDIPGQAGARRCATAAMLARSAGGRTRQHRGGRSASHPPLPGPPNIPTPAFRLMPIRVAAIPLKDRVPQRSKASIHDPRQLARSATGFEDQVRRDDAEIGSTTLKPFIIRPTSARSITTRAPPPWATSVPVVKSTARAKEPRCTLLADDDHVRKSAVRQRINSRERKSAAMPSYRLTRKPASWPSLHDRQRPKSPPPPTRGSAEEMVRLAR